MHPLREGCVQELRGGPEDGNSHISFLKLLGFFNASTKRPLDLGRWKIQLKSHHQNLEALREFLVSRRKTLEIPALEELDQESTVPKERYSRG